jgi:hypothetical protein
MAYSTAQVAPSSIAIVQPSMRHPSLRAPKYTTSKPDRAPRWCQAAVAGTGAKGHSNQNPTETGRGHPIMTSRSSCR